MEMEKAAAAQEEERARKFKKRHSGRARSFELAAERVAEEAMSILGAFAPRSRKGTAAFCFGFGARVQGLPYGAGDAFPLGASMLLEGAGDAVTGSESRSQAVTADAADAAPIRRRSTIFSLGNRARSDASGLAWAAGGPPSIPSETLCTPHRNYELDRPAGAMTDVSPRDEDEGSRFMLAARLRGLDAVRTSLRAAILSVSESFGDRLQEPLTPEEAKGPGPVARAVDASIALVQLDAPSPGRQRYGVSVLCLHRSPSYGEIEHILSR